MVGMLGHSLAILMTTYAHIARFARYAIFRGPRMRQLGSWMVFSRQFRLSSFSRADIFSSGNSSTIADHEPGQEVIPVDECRPPCIIIINSVDSLMRQIVLLYTSQAFQEYYLAKQSRSDMACRSLLTKLLEEN
jgi:hypothetical protein